MTETSPLLWTQPDWIKGAQRWVIDQLAQHGLHLLKDLEQIHVRPWSTVFRAPTNGGNYFFKATTPSLAYEAALTESLVQLWPDLIPRVLAAEKNQGWLLMEDGGLRLREALKSADDITHWHSILPIYAQLQRELSSRQESLLALGVLDRRPAMLPDRYNALLADTSVLNLNRPSGLSTADYRRLTDFSPNFARLCADLSRFSVPETLDHGDFHDGNIFFQDGRYLFFDWGDSSISHPFFSLRTIFVSIENTFGVDENSPWFTRLRDIYLAEWSVAGISDHLLEAYFLSRRLAPIIAALRWWQAMAVLDDPDSSDYAGAIPSLLREFLSLNDDA
jgi:aminoglycoside/choline kinase family phosphotransferase